MDAERSSESLGPNSDQSLSSNSTEPSVATPILGKALRAEAKPFVPPAAGTTAAYTAQQPPPPPRYSALAPSVTVSPAHYDEEGNVVYPARVCTTQDPNVQRIIAARDYQLGFRARRSRNAPIAPQLAGAAQFAVFMKGNAVYADQAPSQPSGGPAPTTATTSESAYNPLATDVLGDAARSAEAPGYTPAVDPVVEAERLLREFGDGGSDDGFGSDDDDIVVMRDPNPAETIATLLSKDDEPQSASAPTAISEVPQAPASAAELQASEASLLPPPDQAPPRYRQWEASNVRGRGGRRGGHFHTSEPVAVPLHFEPPPYMPSGGAYGPPPPAHSATHGSALLPPPPPPHASGSARGPALLSVVPVGSTAPGGRTAPVWAAVSPSGDGAAVVGRTNTTWNGKRTQESSSLQTPQDILSEESEHVSHTLKVNPDTFFSDPMASAVQADVNKDIAKALPNPFSLQSLQGVRRAEANMPLIQVVWQKVIMQGSETWVPPPFPALPDEVVRLHNGAKHYDVARPLTHPNVMLHLYHYRCSTCPIEVYPGKINERPADVKLGGICGDVPALCIAHLVEVITKVKILAVDIFGNNLGRCNLWLQNPEQVPELTAKFDRRMWMSPVAHGYAILAPDEDAREYLLWYLESLRAYGPKFVRFPRHLVTCEKWIA